MRQHQREFDNNNTHTIMFDPDYNMMPFFISTATNILLIKSDLKFESRASAVSVAMSPRYLGGKYRSRLLPRSWKCAWQFLRETGRVKSTCARPAAHASRGDNEDDHAVCLKAGFQMHTVFSNENGKFYTTMIYPCFSRSVCFSIACLIKVWPLFTWGFPRVPMTWRSFHAHANFKCDVADVNK